jgi:hypothetical protein
MVFSIPHILTHNAAIILILGAGHSLKVSKPLVSEPCVAQLR